MDKFTKWLIVSATGLGILVPAATGAARLAPYKDKDSYTNSSYWAEVFFCIAATFMIVLGSIMMYANRRNKSATAIQQMYTTANTDGIDVINNNS
jgi:hypothetical protein